MNHKLLKPNLKENKPKILAFAVIFISIFVMSSVQAITLEELIDSYSFDYSNGQIDVASVSDSINGNVLSFNLNVTNVSTGNYTVYVDLRDIGGIVSGKRLASISSVGIFQVNLSTYLLSGTDKFNYTLRVYDEGNTLVLRKSKLATQTYSSYDSGYEIVSVNDLFFHNKSLVLNITINSSLSLTENVTAFLGYGSKEISSKTQKTFSPGINTVFIEFTNETIKSTHHNGTFSLDNVLIGQKLVPYNYTTASYNYVNFAKTSFIESADSIFNDDDNDSLVDSVTFRFLVNSKQAGTYGVTMDIHDLNGNYVMTVNDSKSISTGYDIVRIEVNGSLLYSFGIDGPYVLKSSKLNLGGQIIDAVEDIHTTEEFSFLLFERPLQPDLIVNMTLNEVSGNYVANVTIQNIGQVPAFNVKLDVFDDKGQENVSSYEFLNVSEKVSRLIQLNGTSSETIVAVADFESRVDEKNESNNIAVVKANDLFGPTTPTIYHPTGGEIFPTNLILLVNWSLSTSSNGNPVTYFLEYSNNSGLDWFSIISNFGFEDSLNDSSTEKTVTFAGDENKTVYLRIPKNASVNSAKLNVEGFLNV